MGLLDGRVVIVTTPLVAEVPHYCDESPDRTVRPARPPHVPITCVVVPLRDEYRGVRNR